MSDLRPFIHTMNFLLKGGRNCRLKVVKANRTHCL